MLKRLIAAIRAQTVALGLTNPIFLTVCKYALALGLLAFVVVQNWRPASGHGLGHMWDKYARQGQAIPHPEFFLLAIAVNLAAALITFVRWYLMVRGVGLPFRISDALRLGLVGFFFNVLLPGSVGGDILKAAFLAREQPGRRTMAVATVVIDRILALWALVLFVAVLGLSFWAGAQLTGDFAERLKMIVTIASGLGVASLVGWLLLGFLSDQRAERFAGRLERGLGHVPAEFWRAFWIYRCRPRTVVAAMALSFTGFVGFVLTFYLSVLTLREPGQVVPNWQEHFLIIPIGMVIQAIPGFPGGLGIGEAGFGGLYKLLGCEYSLGVLGSLVQRVIAWIIAGGGYLVYLRMKPALAQAVEQERADPVAAFAAGDLPCPP